MNLADGLKWMVENPMREILCYYQNQGPVRNRYNPVALNFQVFSGGVHWMNAQTYSTTERFELIPLSVPTLEDRVRKLEESEARRRL